MPVVVEIDSEAFGHLRDVVETFQKIETPWPVDMSDDQAVFEAGYFLMWKVFCKSVEDFADRKGITVDEPVEELADASADKTADE